MLKPQKVKAATPQQITTALQGTWVIDSVVDHFLSEGLINSAAESIPRSSDVGAKYIIKDNAIKAILPAENGFNKRSVEVLQSL